MKKLNSAVEMTCRCTHEIEYSKETSREINQYRKTFYF